MWSTSGATCTPRASRSSSTRWVNGRPALGISALPGSSAKIVWRSRERARAGEVAVGDRAAVLGEVVVQRRRQVERGDPQAARARGRTASSSAEPPPGSARRSAGGARAAGARARARRSSTHPGAASPPAPLDGAGTGVERCRSTAVPSARVAGSAAGIVAEVLTTSRSPARRWRGQAAEHVVDERAAALRRRAGAPRRARPRGGAPASWAGVSVNASARSRARLQQRPGAVAAARQVALDQREQPGHALLGRRRGRRCPRPGTPPGACACSCRRGRSA